MYDSNRRPIQAGELCFLHHCVLQENNGRVVTTEKRHLHAVDGEGWVVTSQTPYTTMVHHVDGSKGEGLNTRFFVKEHQLIPIRDSDGETDECSRIRSPSLEHCHD